MRIQVDAGMGEGFSGPLGFIEDGVPTSARREVDTDEYRKSLTINVKDLPAAIETITITWDY